MFKTDQDVLHEEFDEWLKEREPDFLEKQNDLALRTGKTQFFEELHIYYFSNFLFRISVTGFLHSFFSHFEEEKVISEIIESGRTLNGRYKYYNMTFKKIKRLW